MTNLLKRSSVKLSKYCLIFVSLFFLTAQSIYAWDDGQPVVIKSESPISDAQRYNISAYYLDEKGVGLAYIGTRHTFDPENSQIEGIERFFQRFKPTLVLLEGGDWPVAESKEQSIRRYGEIGFTRYLAARANVKTQSADPLTADEYNAVLKRHTPSEAKLYYALRFVPQWSKQETGLTLEENLARFLGTTNFTQFSSVSADVSPRNIKELELLCSKLIPDLKDWRTVQFDLSFDGGKNSILTEVDRTASAFRNAHIEQKIIEGLQHGERVFVISGVTHLAKILPQLRPKLAALK